MRYIYLFFFILITHNIIIVQGIDEGNASEKMSQEVFVEYCVNDYLKKCGNIIEIDTKDKEGLMETLNIFIEIPKNSCVKYEIDKETGLLVVDRFMYTAMNYPFNYGYLPDTKAKDGDAVDVMVISTHSVQAGCMLPSRIIGMLEMEDEAGLDNKVIAVPTKKIDPFYAHIEDIADFDDATKNLIKHFFENYKSIEPGKWVKMKEFVGKDAAMKEIEESR